MWYLSPYYFASFPLLEHFIPLGIMMWLSRYHIIIFSLFFLIKSLFQLQMALGTMVKKCSVSVECQLKGIAGYVVICQSCSQSTYPFPMFQMSLCITVLIGLCLLSVLPGKCWDIALKYVTCASFCILPNSSFTHLIRCRIMYAVENLPLIK
jgi:hypothetical protein